MIYVTSIISKGLIAEQARIAQRIDNLYADYAPHGITRDEIVNYIHEYLIASPENIDYWIDMATSHFNGKINELR